MFYAIICTDVADSLPLRAKARPAHLERIQRLLDEGRLLTAGPLPVLDTPEPGAAGFSGSLIIAEFESLAQARDWADADPYVTGGVFREVIVKPFKQVLP